MAQAKAISEAAIRVSPPALSLCTNCSKGLSKRFIVLFCMPRYYIIGTVGKGQSVLESQDLSSNISSFGVEQRESVLRLTALVGRAARVEE